MAALSPRPDDGRLRHAARVASQTEPALPIQPLEPPELVRAKRLTQPDQVLPGSFRREMSQVLDPELLFDSGDLINHAYKARQEDMLVRRVQEPFPDRFSILIAKTCDRWE
jgi:hypothetical protein